MSEAIVKISSTSKTFDHGHTYALKSINVDIPRGKIVGLVGPDGAGKTTLLRLIAGLLMPSSGQIKVNHFDTIKEAQSVHQIIGYMPQKFGLYEELSVMQNLALYAELRGIADNEREATYDKLLAFTGLKPFIERLAGALSGGMKQKLGLACALIAKPTLLLLDEPSAGVDPISRRELWKMVQNLMNEGISIIWSTSYLDEAEKCENVKLLNLGQIIFDGPPNSLAEQVKNRTFHLTDISTARRSVLLNTLRSPEVMDAIIEGDKIRVLLKPTQTLPSIESLKAGKEAKFVPVPSRFEDGFLNILGGGPGGFSLLAENIPYIPPKQGPIVEAKGLVKRFGSFTAASQITFSIKSGEIFGLLGPNGAGKSTTFKMMCGLLKPNEGQAIVTGYDLQHAPGKARSRIGYMAQKFSLYGNLSVEQNLLFFSGIYNVQGKVKQQIIDEMVQTFSLEPYLDTNADALPLGFKQRLALSCSLMHHPDVLFLDEPTSGVDPITRREFWNHINNMVHKGTTVMVTTHFLDEAEYCDRIGLVYRSKLIRLGTPESLKNEARSNLLPEPTLEDAFIKLIEDYDRENPL